MTMTNYPFKGIYAGKGTVVDDYYGTLKVSVSGTLSASISTTTTGNVAGNWTYTGTYSASGKDPESGRSFSYKDAVSDSGTVGGTTTNTRFTSTDAALVDASASFSGETVIVGDAQVTIPGETGAIAAHGIVKATPLPPVIKIDHYTGRISEAAGDVSMTLARVGSNLSLASSVTITIEDGAAVSSGDNADYTPLLNDVVVNFAPGQKTAEVTFASIAADTQAEPNENFHVRLTNPDSATLGFAMAEIIIVDNDQYGTDGDDKIKGDKGDNSLFGQAGNDALQGGQGQDTLDGGSGNDILTGGAGNDVLSGGAGDDRFVFDSALGPQNLDTITDFSTGSDGINLNRKIFSAYKKAGSNLSLDLVAEANPVAHDSSDHFLYDTTTGILSYDPDGNGGKAAIPFAQLTGAPALLAADLHII